MVAHLALAVGSALGTSIAFLLKQRGALLAPPVRARHPLRSAVGLFRSRWFSLGWAVAVVAWGLHVGALALAPLSIVQAVLSGGLVFLAVLVERYFGFRLGRRQWGGVIITAAGLAVIAITGGHTPARLGPRAPVGSGRGRHRLHLSCRESRRDHGGHPGLPRSDWNRRARNRRTGHRFRPRYRRRGIHARACPSR